MAKWRTSAKTLFEQVFPERQIYHRSSGTVNYISVSPVQQSVIAVGCVAFLSWVMFATGAYLLSSNGTGFSGNSERELARLTRWNEELSAKEALYKDLLEERTDAFQRATVDFEERHTALETMLRALESNDDIEVTALKGNGAEFLIDASIDNADPRQSRETEIQTASLEVVGVRARINKLRAEQEKFLDKAETVAVERAEQARGVLDLASVPLQSLSLRTGDTGLGGPLVNAFALGASEADTPEERAFAERVLQVATRLDEARNYEKVVQSLPMAIPSSIKTIRITSNYGLRTDPFSSASAWHSGIDMGVGAYGGRAPITAAGPGKVIFAGRNSSYGRVVDIDHGSGFVSRYAHLRSFNVKVGDEVVIGDKVGIMGSSGRSTARHLHFEVIFQGKPYDPAKFLKAGQHVHKK